MSLPLLQQAQREGLCLNFPDSLGSARELTFENAIMMLMKTIQMASERPFIWRYIDKPQEGQLAIIFLSPQNPFPNDGIRYQEAESSITMPVQGGRELEISEAKSGFIPGSQDQNAWRVRRRYRLIKGGHPNLVLVHYTRGQPNPIAPAVANQPIRIYPLRTVNEPPTFVVGEKAGQKVYPPGMQPGAQQQQQQQQQLQLQQQQQQSMSAGPSSGPGGNSNNIMPGGPPGMGNMGFNNPAAQAAMISQQTAAMEQLERRREREMGKDRAAAAHAAAQRGVGGGVPGHGLPGHGRGPHVSDTLDDDDTEAITTRALAMTRYKRNHDLMNAVFKQAAFGDKSRPQPIPAYSMFNKEELERKTAKLQAEIEALRGRERRVVGGGGGNAGGDVTMAIAA